MNPIVIKFGGYQKSVSIHTRAAAQFGAALTVRLGERVRFELIESVLDLGRKSGDLPLMVESAEDAEIMAKFDSRENDVIHLTEAERVQFIAAVRPVQKKYRKELEPRLFEFVESRA